MENDEEKAWIFSSFDPTDLVRASQGIADGRVTFVRGNQEVLPGVTARLAKDSHTFGSQWFKVETRNGPYIIAGDTVYWYSNVERMWPPGYNQGNPFNLIEVYRAMQHELQRETTRIVPGHDPHIWQRHPSWVHENGNEVAEINLREGDASRRPGTGAGA